MFHRILDLGVNIQKRQRQRQKRLYDCYYIYACIRWNDETGRDVKGIFYDDDEGGGDDGDGCQISLNFDV